jgi:alpha-tubulin suppressor-like RCC1 family protein
MQVTVATGMMGSAREQRNFRVAVVAVASAGLALACTEGQGPTVQQPLPPTPFVVSSPVPIASSATASVARSGSVFPTVVYISLPPAAIPDGLSATIEDPRVGSSITTVLVDGGFDPVALAAAVGDTLMLVVRTDSDSVVYRCIVAGNKPPVVVRTSPPPHKRDVALNARLVVVFSTQVDSTTLNSTSIQLWRNMTRVAGQIAAGDPAHLTASFAPDAPLTGLTNYELRVTQGILGAAGAPLKAPVSVPFTTQVASTAPYYSVSVRVSGLAGTGLSLLNNGADPLSVTANGTFTFATPLASGTAYTVTVFAQPANPAQTCSVINGSGTVVAANLINVAIACATGSHTGLMFVSVSEGYQHTCGVTTVGTAYCWGDNSSGQLGDGTTANSTTPVAVAGGLTFAAVSASASHTCGLTTSGAAYCWGRGGLLGDSLGTGSSTPVPVAGGHTFASVSAGSVHSCGVTTAGAAYCWGEGYYGELGVGSPAITTTPRAVVGGLTFAAVSAGVNHSCGVTMTGAAYCWGMNTYGELGAGTSTGPEQCQHGGSYACSTIPVAVAGGLTFGQVGAGAQAACGLTSSGIAYCWGDNEYNLLGVHTAWGPEQCQQGAKFLPCSRTPVKVAGGPNLASLFVGVWFACGLSSSHAVYCWGDQSNSVFNGSTFATLSVGEGLTCGVATAGQTWISAGEVFCWNRWDYLKRGTGTTTTSTVPVKVAGQP